MYYNLLTENINILFKYTIIIQSITDLNTKLTKTWKIILILYKLKNITMNLKSL